MDPMIGKEIGGCYINELIGQGGMGAVYRAHHSGLDITVAVKILLPTLPITNEVQRFFREARTAAKLRHPNIIGVLNVGCENNTHFIVMEYIDGSNILDIIKKRKKFSVADTIRIGIEVLSALEVAFDNGIVHRDIKPENILIDKSGNVKLADLGLALIDGDTRLTQPSIMLGSPFYIAPEQAENSGSVDFRADIYSLGCTLFHMISGVPPYRGESPVEIILAHLKKPIPELRKIDHSIPAELSDIIHTMMEKKPSKRFRSPKEAKQFLQSINGVTLKSKVVHSKSRAMPLQSLPPMIIAGLSLVIITFVITLFFILNNKNMKPPRTFSTEINPNASQTTYSQTKITADSLHLRGSISRSEPQIRSVLQAVLEKNAIELNNLLNNGVSPNPMPGDSISPLHAAVSIGDSATLLILLNKGADPNIRGKSGNTPLHDAIRTNDIIAVKILLRMGANPNFKDQSGKKPLLIAKKNKAIAVALRNYGGSIR